MSYQYQQWIEAIAAYRSHKSFNFSLKITPIAEEVFTASPERQKEFTLALEEYIIDIHKEFILRPSDSEIAWTITHSRQAWRELLELHLLYTEEEILRLLQRISRAEFAREHPSMQKILVEYLQKNLLTPVLQEALLQATSFLKTHFLINTPYTLDLSSYNGQRQSIAELRYIGNPHLLPLREGDTWANSAIKEIIAMEPECRELWSQLLQLCATTTSSKPNEKWKKSTRILLNKISLPDFQEKIIRWFSLANQPDDGIDGFIPSNAEIIKGLVWLCTEIEGEDITRSLVSLTLCATRIVKKHGKPKSVRVANACIWALGQQGYNGIIGLNLLKTGIKTKGFTRPLESTISEAAVRLNLTPAALEEMTIPTYGLDINGVRREVFDDFTAELAIEDGNSPSISWYKADGKPQKSVPKSVKDNYPAALKELKQASQDIQKMLTAQRNRIESFYLTPKTWDLSQWRERYLDHPLVGTIARRLIWQFIDDTRRTSGIWSAGKIVGEDGQPLDWLEESTRIELWHPLFSAVETVLDWRNYLEKYAITQPFKQAHREIYILTEAERETRFYSNRFATHIIKQHQFSALCHTRGWKYDLIAPGAWEDRSRSQRFLSHWDLSVEFEIEQLDAEYSESGIALYLTTDRVCFYSNTVQEHDPLALESIPVLVFSEIMRDVDLFIGVTSIGNDPSWTDGGLENLERRTRLYDYWMNYSGISLSEIAQTRRQILQTVIPRLKIGDRCKVTDKFLIVSGDIQTYKIHLGSGNILIESTNQYVCIVPARKEVPSKVFLPFEGDEMISIILSKAMLLAADRKITDPAIVRQISAGVF